MKTDFKIIFFSFLLILAIGGLLLPLLPTDGTISGHIAAVYRNGQYNRTFHFKIEEGFIKNIDSDNKDGRTVDIVVPSNIYDTYEVGDNVKITYNPILKTLNKISRQ